MKRLISLLLLMATLFSLCACDTSHTPSTDPSDSGDGSDPTGSGSLTGVTKLNVMSFNVLGNNSESKETSNGDPVDMRIKRRAPHLNDVLLGEQIDIAGVQEMNAVWQSWLEVGLDKAYAYVGTHTAKTGEGGYIIYNKKKLTALKDGVFWIADGAPSASVVGWDGKYDRICTWALFQVNQTSEYLLFMNTHLDHQGTLARAYGAKLIVEQMQQLRATIEDTYNVKDCPVVITGDMNAEPGSAAYSKFTAGLVDSFHAAPNNPFDEDTSTSPGLYYRTSEDAFVVDGHRIDYVFISKENITALKYNMLHTATNLCSYGQFLSDHNAVVVAISITN